MNIFFVSLGCDKNLVDSEMMITSLRKNGFVLTDDIEDADVIVVNTCCFIGDAKEESINTLIEMGGYKEGRCKLLVAAAALHRGTTMRLRRIFLKLTLLSERWDMRIYQKR